jgi:hypothetical protein
MLLDPNHPMCTRCGRPIQPAEFGICFCLTESDEKAAATKARLDADFAQQRKDIENRKEFGMCWNCGRVFESEDESDDHLEYCW